ncbi:MAG: hypothetical protein GXY56_05310, partial [Clostridiales bacterium]|nr:hypothetical protein [Clostridiales bacterium]
MAELANMFLPATDYEFLAETDSSHSFDLIVGETEGDGNRQKQIVYDFFTERTGRTLDWGILTGVRPVKLLAELLSRQSPQEVQTTLRNEYRVSSEKVELLLDVYKTQTSVHFDPAPPAVGLYVGIPFCPSRCLYCSFPSNVISEEGARHYLEALYKEIDAVSGMLTANGWYSESIYIGG